MSRTLTIGDYVQFLTTNHDFEGWIGQIHDIQYTLFSGPDYIVKPTGYMALGRYSSEFYEADPRWLDDDAVVPDYFSFSRKWLDRLNKDKSYYIRALQIFGNHFHSIYYANNKVVIGRTPCMIEGCSGLAEVETVVNRYGSVGFIYTCQACHQRENHKCIGEPDEP